MLNLNEMALVMVGSVATTIGALFLWKAQRRHEKDDRLLAKLENLLTVTEKFITSLHVAFLNRYSVMSHKISVDQMHDIEIEEKADAYATPPYTQLQTLVNLYFPALQEPLRDVHHAKQKCFEVFEEYKSKYREIGHHHQVEVKILTARMKEFDAAANILRQGIVDEANKLTGIKSSYKSLGDLSEGE